MTKSKQKNRIGLWAIVTIGLLAGAVLVGRRVFPPGRAESGKPNIIFILTDDLGYGDLGSYGQTLIKTPNLDRMAAEGIRFTDCYSGSTVCASARCGLMTGLHNGHAYIRTNSKPPDTPLRKQDETVAELLKSAGYSTGVIGKWGLGGAVSSGNPTRKGFDYSYCFLEHGEGDYFPTYLWRDEQPVLIRPGSYQQALFTDDAVQFIRRNHKHPFFLYLAYMVPHAPAGVPDEGPYKKMGWPKQDREYAAMISYMDRDVGHIFQTLKEMGLDDDTVVFFSSDNGPPRPDFFHSAGPLNGQKRSLYEGGIRIPMIVRWPGRITPGQVSNQPWAFWDFMPTAADIAGIGPPSGLDGISMLPTLTGVGQQAPHKPLYWEFYVTANSDFLQAVRMGKWKAIRDIRDGQVSLYDLDVDIGENTDVAAQHPDIIAGAVQLMKQEHTPCLTCGTGSEAFEEPIHNH